MQRDSAIARLRSELRRLEVADELVELPHERESTDFSRLHDLNRLILRRVVQEFEGGIVELPETDLIAKLPFPVDQARSYIGTLLEERYIARRFEHDSDRPYIQLTAMGAEMARELGLAGY